MRFSFVIFMYLLTLSYEYQIMPYCPLFACCVISRDCVKMSSQSFTQSLFPRRRCFLTHVVARKMPAGRTTACVRGTFCWCVRHDNCVSSVGPGFEEQPTAPPPPPPHVAMALGSSKRWVVVVVVVTDIGRFWVTGA